MALQRYERMPARRSPAEIEREIAALEAELAERRACRSARAAALRKNLELKRRLLASLAAGRTTRCARCRPRLDSMESLLEVLHQNSISLRDPQAIADELDTIVRQSEDSERVVREMEALLRTDTDGWQGDLVAVAPVPPIPAATERRVRGGAAEGEGPMSTTFDDYPRWARTLAHGIRARLGNTFVLHGNTHDLVPVPKPAGEAARRRRLRAAHARSWPTGCSASARW